MPGSGLRGGAPAAQVDAFHSFDARLRHEQLIAHDQRRLLILPPPIMIYLRREPFLPADPRTLPSGSQQTTVPPASIR